MPRLLGLAPAALAALALAGDAPGVVTHDHVRVSERRAGNSVTLRARLRNCSRATITVTAELENLQASRPLPLTVDVDRPETPLLRFSPARVGSRYRHSFHVDWLIGARRDGDPPAHAYELPYAAGTSFRVIQGASGPLSHQPGSNDENAIDFGMPEGTPVLASRSGEVVALRRDSDASGWEPKYLSTDNFVVVAHDDGTFAEYRHLLKDGVAVKLGQAVRARDLLGDSGRSGHAKGPHLHFAVYYTIDGKKRRTLPPTFRTREGTTESLVQGRSYRAP